MFKLNVYYGCLDTILPHNFFLFHVQKKKVRHTQRNPFCPLPTQQQPPHHLFFAAKMSCRLVWEVAESRKKSVCIKSWGVGVRFYGCGGEGNALLLSWCIFTPAFFQCLPILKVCVCVWVYCVLFSHSVHLLSKDFFSHMYIHWCNFFILFLCLNLKMFTYIQNILMFYEFLAFLKYVSFSSVKLWRFFWSLI